MFLFYLKDRLPWIFFFAGCLIWVNFLIYLDTGFKLISIMYMNLTTIFFFLVFLLWRYFRESIAIKEIDEDLSEYQCMNDVFLARIKGMERKFEHYQNELNIRRLQERDEHLAWIHEVKTPLTALKLMIEDLPREYQKPLQVEWLRIHLLLDQTLHTLRLAEIEQDTMMQEIDLSSVIMHEVKELQSWCLAKNLAIEIEGDEEKVLTDQKWLSFLIRQILTNAVKYSHNGDAITIQMSYDKEGHKIVSIEDTGEGITPSDLPRIFDKSFTGTTGRKQSASTGMGLYLARNAAFKLGINLTVQSTINEGSTFTLTFPTTNTYLETIAK